MSTAIEIASKIRSSGWLFALHVSMSDGGLGCYRSAADRRVTLVRLTKERGGASLSYHFADSDVDVPVMPGGPIVEGADVRSYATIDELAEAIARHDAALGSERDWEASAP